MAKRAIGFDKKKMDALMDQENIDVIIALKPQNIFYTTGFPSLLNDVIPLWGIVNEAYPQISIIPKDKEQVLIAPISAERDARIHSWVRDYRSYATKEDAFNLVRKSLEEMELVKGTIAIESTIPFYAYTYLRNKLPDATLKTTADELLSKVKKVKSDEEIRRLKKAAEIGQKATVEAIENMKEGTPIIDLIQIVKSTIIKEGGTGWYHTNVWSEKKREEDKGYFSKVVKGDLVSLDIGAVYYGYTSDMRRTAFVGMDQPSNVRKMYDVICEALDAVIEAIRPGVRLGQIYDIAHNILHRAGYPGKFGWSIGHSIGVEVEEEPKIVEGSKETFESNMAFAVEMWYPIEPWPTFGVGVEEMGIITKKGFEKYTTMDRNIYIVK